MHNTYPISPSNERTSCVLEAGMVREKENYPLLSHPIGAGAAFPPYYPVGC